MTRRKEFEFAEVLVDKLFLESIANERSAYYSSEGEAIKAKSLDKFRNRLKWHVRHSLSKRQKQVVMLYLIGKKEREIAEQLGITQQVVNIYKHRAIKKLHDIIDS